jgi:hypothetical protein
MMVAIAGIGLLSLPALGADTPQPTMEQGRMPQPGTLNYVEGAASVEGRPIGNKEVGNLELNAGEELTTGSGKAEILLTPGIFLRVDSNSAVKMISPDLARTQVAVERGRAGVEVDQIFAQNCVQVIDAGVTTQLIKPGYYEFNANQPEAMVFSGRAEVLQGGDNWKALKSHHELALNDDGRGKAVDFDANPSVANDELYNWSSLRSQYLAEDNNQIAGEYAYGAGFYPGWYWDPYAWDYTFVGWGPFMSPFGWGFYPWGGYWGGWGGWYGRGFYGGRGFHGGGFHGGGLHGGGFGGGGFHGGGFGGGMRGGR